MSRHSPEFFSLEQNFKFHSTNVSLKITKKSNRIGFLLFEKEKGNRINVTIPLNWLEKLQIKTFSGKTTKIVIKKGNK
jgi:hypothetical protein